ncbi:MAG: hypothetical protein PHN92_13270 [Geobacter sp.]|nr:hypothetical protein [Geobacter sp.]
MKRYYCTYFDKAYLVKGVAMITSLAAHESRPFTIYVVCLDELTRLILSKLKLWNVVLVPLHLIEQGDQALLEARQNRSLTEYYWTLTPTVVLRILERYPEVDLLTYLDADLFFYSAPDPIFYELGDRSVLIHEHRFPERLQHLAAYGKYNVGLLVFRKDEKALKALKWWRTRCNEWCYMRVEEGKYGDQLYLDDWPERFEGVQVLQHVGAGLAAWNQIQYSYTRKNDQFLVNGLPIVFYHFHAVNFLAPEVMILSRHSYCIARTVVENCYFPYLLHLMNILQLVRTIQPDFSLGFTSQGVLQDDYAFIMPKTHRHLVADLLAGTPIIDLDDRWICYCSKQVI